MRAVLKRLWSFRLALAIYAILLAAGWGAGELLLGMTVPELRPMNEPMIHRMVMGALVLFVVMAAIPFVPGAEIGFALLLMFGGQASGIVYAGMVGALLLSFTVARFVPLSLLSQLTASLRLAGAARFFDLLASMPAEERSRFISDRLDGQFSSTLFEKQISRPRHSAERARQLTSGWRRRSCVHGGYLRSLPVLAISAQRADRCGANPADFLFFLKGIVPARAK